MEKELYFEAAYLDRYPNAMHQEYHSEVFSVLTDGTVEPEAMFLKPDLMAEWKGNIDVEVKQCRKVRADVLTAQMDAEEQNRDGFISYAFNRIRTAATSPYAEEREAGEVLAPIPESYAGLQTEAAHSQTGNTRGLVEDLRSAKYAAAVAALQLEKTVDDIEKSNNTYAELYAQRMDAITLDKLPPAKENRRRSDANLTRVLFFIQAAYLLSDDADLKAAIAALVDRLNTRTADFRARYNQMMAQKYGPGNGLPSTDGESNADGDTEDGSSDGSSSSDGTDGSDGSTEPDETTPETGDSGEGGEGGSGETGGTDSGDTGGTGGGNDDDEEVVG